MSTALTEGVEMRDGSLRFDPGRPPPETVPPGYERDAADAWRLNLQVNMGPCVERTKRACVHGRERWYCERRITYVNPAACCRCQGLLQPLTA